MDKLKNFKFWCHKVLPLVYDDSLSYYEFLCKVMKKLNEVIEAINEIIEGGTSGDIAEMKEAIAELQEAMTTTLNEGDLVLNPDDVESPTTLENIKYLNEFFSVPSGGSGGTTYNCTFDIAIDNISIPCKVDVIGKTMLLHLPNLSGVIESNHTIAAINGIPNEVVVPTTNFVLKAYGGTDLKYSIPIQISKVLNTAMTLYLLDDVISESSISSSVIHTKATKSMYYLQYVSHNTIVLTME